MSWLARHLRGRVCLEITRNLHVIYILFVGADAVGDLVAMVRGLYSNPSPSGDGSYKFLEGRTPSFAEASDGKLSCPG